jgi:hypothetical protein
MVVTQTGSSSTGVPSAGCQVVPQMSIWLQHSMNAQRSDCHNASGEHPNASVPGGWGAAKGLMVPNQPQALASPTIIDFDTPSPSCQTRRLQARHL